MKTPYHEQTGGLLQIGTKEKVGKGECKFQNVAQEKDK